MHNKEFFFFNSKSNVKPPKSLNGELGDQWVIFGSMIWFGICKWAQLWDNEVGTRVMVFKKWKTVRSKINVPYQWERWERMIGLWIDILSLIHTFKKLIALRDFWLYNCLDGDTFHLERRGKHWPTQASEFEDSESSVGLSHMGYSSTVKNEDDEQ